MADILFIFTQKLPQNVLQQLIGPFLLELKQKLDLPLSEEDLNRLLMLLSSLKPKLRYRAMFNDFSKICSGEAAPDVLFCYEL